MIGRSLAQERLGFQRTAKARAFTLIILRRPNPAPASRAN